MKTKKLTKAESLPCPFCGCQPKAQLNEESLPELTAKYWSVSCSGSRRCHVSPMSFGDTMAGAVAVWNRRNPRAHVLFTVVVFTAKDSVCEGAFATEAEALAEVKKLRATMRGALGFRIDRVESILIHKLPGSKKGVRK